MSSTEIVPNKTATKVKDITSWRGDARLYKLDPPLELRDWDEQPTGETTDYVVVSAVVVPYSGPETYIFPARADGKVVDFGELPGSFRGGLDHVEALRGAGYEVSA